jgi:hypothetical protein
MRGKCSATTLALLIAIGLLATAAPAGAVITAQPHNATGAAAAANALASTGFTPGTAAFVDTPLNNTPIGGNPVGVSTSQLSPFPRGGVEGSFLVLSTGDSTQADQANPDLFVSESDGGGEVGGRGASAEDVTVLQIPFTAPTAPAGSVSCLSFDFRFLSEEYPEYIDSDFNDAFIAELDATTWTTSGSEVQGLANDFALDPQGHPVTIKSTGPTSMSPVEGAGTPYDGATAPLRASTPVTTAGAHNLFLSIFDQADSAWDTAAFVDNVTLVTVPAGSCPRGSLGLGPALTITGPASGSTVGTATPTLTGTAGDAAGDAGSVTVRIYQGPLAVGAPIQTLAAPRSGTSWSTTTQPLAPGPYTAQATQANGQGINGVSSPLRFTVVPQIQNAPSQAPSDRDGDGIPDSQDTNDGSRPPVPGKSVQVRVVSGDVYIKLPKGASARALGPPKGFVPLKGAANIPVGSQLDTEDGRVALTSAADTGGAKTQTSDFYQGIFQVKQTVPKKKPKKPKQLITDLVLKGQLPSSQCGPIKGARAAAEAAKKKKKGSKSVLGQLWGNGKGKFRTSGKYSSATVRGTIWLTQDRCDGTLTKVTRGTVQVRDFKRKKTVTVKAGHSYLARAARAASKSARNK